MKSGSIAIFLSALLVAALSHSAHAEDRVNVARSGIDIAFAPIEVGRDAHIWSDLGLDVEVLDVPGTRIEQVLTSGDADVGLGAAVALGARLKGVPTIGVAAIADLPYNFTLIVPVQSRIKTVGDLRGRAVGVSTAGSLTEWLVKEVSRQQGWSSDGIKTVPLGGDEARIAALRSGGGIDADLAGLMQAVDLSDKGQVRILVYFGDVVKNFQNLVLKASDKFIAEHPDRLERFLQGWYRTVIYMKTHPEGIDEGDRGRIPCRSCSRRQGIARRNEDDVGRRQFQCRRHGGGASVSRRAEDPAHLAGHERSHHRALRAREAEISAHELCR